MNMVIAMHIGITVNSVAKRTTVIIILIQKEANAAKRQAQGKESS